MTASTASLKVPISACKQKRRRGNLQICLVFELYSTTTYTKGLIQNRTEKFSFSWFNWQISVYIMASVYIFRFSRFSTKLTSNSVVRNRLCLFGYYLVKPNRNGHCSRLSIYWVILINEFHSNIINSSSCASLKGHNT